MSYSIFTFLSLCLSRSLSLCMSVWCGGTDIQVRFIMNSVGALGRLSFVCHSLGGIVVRSALSEACLAPYLRHCYTLITLASPHCGTHQGSALVSTGLWVYLSIHACIREYIHTYMLSVESHW